MDEVAFLQEKGKAFDDPQFRPNLTDADGTFESMIREGLATKEQLEQRLEIFAMQEGMSLDQARAMAASGKFRIYARNYAQQVSKSSWKYVIDIFRGADPVNVREDFAEAYWKAGYDNGLFTDQEAIGWIREVENATQNRYLAENYTTENGSMPIMEALGKASIEYALHHYGSDMASPKFRQWVETMLQALGSAWKWFKTMARGMDLQDAIESKQVPQKFADLLADSVGMNEEMRNQRMMQREEANAQAEFLGDFPKLSERIKGKLLHPARAAANNNPLARELRRIYEGLSTSKRTFVSKIDRRWHTYVAKAEAFFADRKENVNLDRLRESLNEEGFQFDTIDEMLEAVNDSLFYGREHYATHSGLATQSDQSFSLAPTDQSNQSNPAEMSDLPTVKASIVKAGIKINGETYNLRNPAPQDLALAAAVQLANKEKDPTDRAWRFGNVLGDTKNQDALSISWVKDYQNALRQQGAQAKQTEQTRAQQEQAALENLFGISASEIIDAIKITVSSYYQQKRGTPTLSQLVYRGESAAPTIASITDSGMGDVSNISKSQYPLIRITLANGGELYQKIRISDHGQVSTNAPRSYDHDYRALNLKDALENTSLMEDMQAVADALWQEQKNALPDTANGAPYTPIQDRDGFLTGQESRQSQDGEEIGTTEQERQQQISTSFSLAPDVQVNLETTIAARLARGPAERIAALLS